MRILILIVLIYLGYRVVRTFLVPRSSGRQSPGTGALGPVDDVMVKDPQCETYFPKKDGVRTVIKGETLYFCSEKCRDEYLDRGRQGS